MTTIQEQRQIVAKFRDSFISRPRAEWSVLKSQRRASVSAPVRGPVWISQDTFNVADEAEVRDVLFAAIQSAKLQDIVLPNREDVEPCNVQVEWVGARKDAVAPNQFQEGNDDEVYQKLIRDTEHPVTIIFCHGGALYTGNHVSARPTTTKLARLTRGRVVSVDYRLSPQNQFPAALLDLLLVYLALLYPPAGSRHEPVSPRHIVLAGESSGGGLCLALIQLLLHLSRQQHTPTPTIFFNNRSVSVPLPSGAALLSAEAERTFCLPSFRRNASIDFLGELQFVHRPDYVPDEVWPTDPPRHDVYCHKSAYLHPFANPAVAEDWTRSPPLWLAYGEERLLDSGKMVAAQAVGQGVVVHFSQWQGLPHIFPIMMSGFSQSKWCMQEWADACKAFAEGRSGTSSAKSVESRELPGDTVLPLDVNCLFKISRKRVMELIQAAADARPLFTRRNDSKSSL